MNDDRLVDIEIKIARQEDLVETLNTMVYQQQKKIDELEALCMALVRRVKDVASEAGDASGRNPADEKPPHY